MSEKPKIKVRYPHRRVWLVRLPPPLVPLLLDADNAEDVKGDSNSNGSAAIKKEKEAIDAKDDDSGDDLIALDDDDAKKSSEKAVAHVQIIKGGVVLHLADDLCGDDVVREWRVDFQKPPPNSMYVLSRAAKKEQENEQKFEQKFEQKSDDDDDENVLGIEGVVEYRGTVLPVAASAQYQRMVRRTYERAPGALAKQTFQRKERAVVSSDPSALRAAAASREVRMTKPFEPLGVGSRAAGRANYAREDAAAARSLRQALKGGKAAAATKKSKADQVPRMERKELMDELFRLFEQKKRYGIKELRDITKQPVSDIKSLLVELCEYNKRGPFKATWELKSEYN
jgi:TFIIF, beta subunit HTH domain